MSNSRAHRLRLLVALAGAATILASTALPAAAVNKSGFKTKQAAMLTGATGVTVQPLITVGETRPGGYRFEAIPDGIAIRNRGQGRVDLFVNHETSTVAFPFQPYVAANPSGTPPTPERFPTTANSQNDFRNSELSRLVLNRKSKGILSAKMVIRTEENFHRFCSNYLATAKEGFDRPILFTNEEASDLVNRQGTSWPATPAFGSQTERAGVVVAYDVRTGQRRPIYGMGRHNHENSVPIPSYSELVILSGDDTFDAPSSQLYSYIAPNTDAVWNDQGHLWAFKSSDPATNDYGDLTFGEFVTGEFILVPDSIARGTANQATAQADLEAWSNSNGVFQFIRVEDIAYDRTNPRIVYFADTGEPRAIPHATNGRLARGPSGTNGEFMNGRIWKMTLGTNPRTVDRLEILLDFDAVVGGGGYANPNTVHQPDNIETTAGSLLIQEDPGGHQQYPTSTGYPDFPNATNARIWRYDLAGPGAGSLSVVATVDQGADEGTTDKDPSTSRGAVGSWESSGIVDASSSFGPGWFAVTVQAHTLFVDVDSTSAPDLSGPGNVPNGQPDWLIKREGGQLLLIRIPGA